MKDLPQLALSDQLVYVKLGPLTPCLRNRKSNTYLQRHFLYIREAPQWMCMGCTRVNENLQPRSAMCGQTTTTGKSYPARRTHPTRVDLGHDPATAIPKPGFLDQPFSKILRLPRIWNAPTVGTRSTRIIESWLLGRNT